MALCPLAKIVFPVRRCESVDPVDRSARADGLVIGKALPAHFMAWEFRDGCPGWGGRSDCCWGSVDRYPAATGRGGDERIRSWVFNRSDNSRQVVRSNHYVFRNCSHTC